MASFFYDPWNEYEDLYPGDPQEKFLKELHESFVNKSAHYLGFPNSRIFDHQALAPFLKFNINNIGDPFYPNAGINTCNLEREVINFFGEIFGLPPEQGWGYITNGGTEGNMYGIACGRDMFPDAHLIFSAESHYCLPKIAHLLRMPYTIAPSMGNGSLDLKALSSIIEMLDGRPCILNLTVGTTFHGAIEEPLEIFQILEAKGCSQFYIHIDAALYGPMLPFIKGAPVFDFRLPINSLSFSGHKFLGSPIPSGVVLCNRATNISFGGCAEYVGSIDTTISGSRDGFTALILWSIISRLKKDGLAMLSNQSIELAKYAQNSLNEVGRVIACLNNGFYQHVAEVRT
jgi:histidine decarboxylase